MIVDDTPRARRILREIVVRAGYRALEASSAREALHPYQQHRPAIVTMDIMTPAIDGVVAIQIMRSVDPLVLVVICFSNRGGSLRDRTLATLRLG